MNIPLYKKIFATLNLLELLLYNIWQIWKICYRLIDMKIKSDSNQFSIFRKNNFFQVKICAMEGRYNSYFLFHSAFVKGFAIISKKFFFQFSFSNFVWIFFLNEQNHQFLLKDSKMFRIIWTWTENYWIGIQQNAFKFLRSWSRICITSTFLKIIKHLRN